MSGSKPYLYQVNSIRVLAMFMIFLDHFWVVYQKVAVGASWEPIFAFISRNADIGLYAFDIITGFMLAYPYALNPQRPLLDMRGVWGKIQKIFPSYLLTIVLFTTMNALVFSSDFFFLKQLEMFLKRVFFIQNFSWICFLDNLGALWWMGLFVQFLIIAPLLLKFLRRQGAWQTSLLSMVLLFGIYTLICYVSPGGTDAGGWVIYLSNFSLLFHGPFMILGMWLAYSVASKMAKVPGQFHWPLTKAMNIFLIVTGVLAVVRFFPIDEMSKIPLSIIARLGLALIVFLLLFTVPWFSQLGKSKWMARGAALSYFFYLAHAPVLSYVNKALLVFTPHLAGLSFFLLLGVLSLILSILVSMALERVGR